MIPEGILSQVRLIHNLCYLFREILTCGRHSAAEAATGSHPDCAAIRMGSRHAARGACREAERRRRAGV